MGVQKGIEEFRREDGRAVGKMGVLQKGIRDECRNKVGSN